MITSNEKLRYLCIKHRLFTAGSNEQYEKFFFINENLNPSIKELAYVLWVCSSDYTLEEITKILKEANEDYLCDQEIRPRMI